MEELTRQQKIEIIQEKIGRKDLTNGCNVETPTGKRKLCFHPIKNKNDDGVSYVYDYGGAMITSKANECKIIGHDVLLSDVIKYIEDKITINDINCIKEHKVLDKLFNLWNTDCRGIEHKDQNDECVDFIFNLVK